MIPRTLEQARKKQGGFTMFNGLFSSAELARIMKTIYELGYTTYPIHVNQNINFIEGLITDEDVQAFFELAEVEI